MYTVNITTRTTTTAVHAWLQLDQTDVRRKHTVVLLSVTVIHVPNL